MPLKTSPAPSKPGASVPSGAPTTALPQATVQLQGTQELGAPTAPTAPTMSTIGTVATDDDDEEENDTIPTVLSILAFVLSLAVLTLALMTWMQDGKGFGDIFG